MKKLMRKLTALLLALVLIASQMALPAMAESTVTENPDGSTTTTETGTVQNPDGSITESKSEITTSASVTSDDTGTTYSVESTWTESETTTTPDSSVTVGDTTTTTGGTSQSTITGSENTVESYFTQGDVQGASQGKGGSETIDTDSTSNTSITQEIDSSSSPQSLEAGPDQSSSDVKPESPQTDSSGNPATTDHDTQNDFQQSMEDFKDVGKLTDDDMDVQTSKTDTKEINMTDDHTPLSMTADQSDIKEGETGYSDNGTADDTSDDYVTRTVRYELDLDNNQVLPAKFFDADGKPFTQDVVQIEENGVTKDYRIEYTYENNDPTGKVTGVKATTIEKVTQSSPAASQESDFGSWTPEGAPTTSSLPASEYEEYTPSFTHKNPVTGQDEKVDLPAVTAAQYQQAAANGSYTFTVDHNGSKVTRTITATTGTNGVASFTITDEVEMAGVDKVDQSLLPQADPGKDETTNYLPARPTAAAPWEQDGVRYTETVEDIVENGAVIGYLKTTIGTDPATGEVISTATHTYHQGTQTEKENTQVQMDGEKTMRKVTVTSTVTGTKSTQNLTRETGEIEMTRVREIAQELYTIDGNNSEIYIEYQGKFYKAQAGANNGQITVSPITPDASLISTTSGTKTWNTTTDLSSHWAVGNNGVNTKGEWQLVEYGMESRTKGWLYRYNGNTYNASEVTHQYVLQDENGNKVYAYCMDANIPVKGKSFYKEDIVANSGYTTAEESAHIQAAAREGFWGTTSGVGSKDAVKAFLKAEIQAVIANSKSNEQLYNALTKDNYIQKYNLTDETSLDKFINNLSEGLMVTATQAAMWYWGRSESDTANHWRSDKKTGETDQQYARRKMMETIISTDSSADALNAHSKSLGGNQTAISQVEKDVTNALFRALALQNTTPDAEPEAMEAADITSTTLTLEGRVTNISDVDSKVYSGAQTKTETVTGTDGQETTRQYVVDENDNGLFKAALSFLVDVQPGAFTGNLNVEIKKPDGTVIASQRIAQEGSNLLGQLLAKTDEQRNGDSFQAKEVDGKIQFTFQDLILAENVKLNLTLSGQQSLTPGVYMYTIGNNSSEFTKSQTFVGIEARNRQVDLSVAMEFKAEDPGIQVSSYEGKKEQEDDKTITRSQKATQETNTVSVTTTATFKDLVKGQKVTKRTLTKKIQEQRAWESYREYLLTNISDEDGGIPGGDPDFAPDGGGQGGGAAAPGGLFIPDEAVPLAAAVKTGDVSLILATICLISLGCAYLLSRREQLG